MSGYTFIAIPTHLVPKVTEFVEQQTAPVHVETVAPSANGASDALLGWTSQLVERAYRESGKPMRQVLEYLAKNRDKEVTSDQIATAINAAYGWNTVAGMLGAFSRRCTGRYARPGFPWEHRWDEQGKGQMKMPASVAQIIESIA